MESQCGNGKMRVLRAERFHSFVHLYIHSFIQSPNCYHVLMNYVHGSVHGSKDREQNRLCTRETWNLVKRLTRTESKWIITICVHCIFCYYLVKCISIRKLYVFIYFIIFILKIPDFKLSGDPPGSLPLNPQHSA